MNKNWEKASLIDVCDFVGGSQPPKSVFSDTLKDGYVRLIQIRDYKSDAFKTYIKKDSTKKFCKKDDIMIGRYGPPVFQILEGLEGAYNVALMKAIPKQDVIDRDYLFWFLKSPEIQNYIISLSQRSAGQSGVNKVALEKYTILYPPLPEQKRIVSKLNALFERIDKSIDLLEENIKQTGHLMASALDEVFSEIDKKYWVELKTISKLITKGSSPNWQGVKYVDEPGVLFITSKNVGNHKLILGDKKTYLETKFNEIQPRSILQKDDILLNIVGASIGRTAKFNLDELANINQAVCLIRLNKELVNVDYMLQFFNSSICISYMFDKKVDNARANLSMGNIQKFLIPTPPIEEQERISMKIGTLLDNIELLRNEQNDKLNNLKALKESILDKAFKGEL